MRARSRALRVIAVVCGLLTLVAAIGSVSQGQDAIDRKRVKELYEKSRRGDKLTPEEQKYLDRAIRELKTKGNPRPGGAVPGAGKWEKTIYVGAVKRLLEERKTQDAVGYKPLTEMSAADKHFGEDGGLYGGGRNEPPAAQQQAAQAAVKRIEPLGPGGKPASDGKVVFVGLGMSNTGGSSFAFRRRWKKGPQGRPTSCS
jgi:hypothetical protein